MFKIQSAFDSSRREQLRMSPRRVITLAVLAAVVPMQDAFAYFDPNAAGWLFQLLFPLIAAVLAGWAFVRNRVSGMWQRLLALFQPRRNSDK
jgi:hypothetical protein